ncbi:MAG: hypothetical protein ACI9CF_001751 [Candidatus Omnitrophota bacterium]|jgi:hypothetical protein
MKHIPKLITLTILSALFISTPSYTQAKEEAKFFMEVMDLSGEVTATKAGVKRPLEERALLGAHEVVYVGANSHVNLALDAQWQNTVHLTQDSKVFVKSVYPTGFYLKRGSLLAKLDNMPKDSTFEIQTPSLIVGARGTIFETRHDEKTNRSTTSTLEGVTGTFAFMPGHNAEPRTIRIPALSQLSNSMADPTLSPLRPIPAIEENRMRANVQALDEIRSIGIQTGRLGNTSLRPIVDKNKVTHVFGVIKSEGAAAVETNKSNRGLNSATDQNASEQKDDSAVKESISKKSTSASNGAKALLAKKLKSAIVLNGKGGVEVSNQLESSTTPSSKSFVPTTVFSEGVGFDGDQPAAGIGDPNVGGTVMDTPLDDVYTDMEFIDGEENNGSTDAPVDDGYVGIELTFSEEDGATDAPVDDGYTDMKSTIGEEDGATDAPVDDGTADDGVTDDV